MVPFKKYTLLNSGPFKDTKLSMTQGHNEYPRSLFPLLFIQKKRKIPSMIYMFIHKCSDLYFC